MPSIKYIKQKSKTYVYIVENNTYTDKLTGKKKSKRTYLEKLGLLGKDVSKSEAKIALSRYMDRKQPLTTDITISLLLDEYLEFYKSQVGNGVKQKTYDLFVFNTRYLNMLKYKKVRDIKFQDIENLKNHLKEKVGNRTINIFLVQLRKILKYAIRKEYLSALPPIDAMKETSKEIARLSLEDIKRLIDNASENMKVYITLMTFSGMRPQECVNLTWDDVVIEKKDKFILIKSDNKLKKGRKIPLHPNLEEFLLELPRETQFVSPYRTTSGARCVLKRLGDRLGITVTPYTLRKSFTSLMVESDASPFELAKMLGHASIKTTYKYYVDIEQKKLSQEMKKHPLGEINLTKK